MGYVFLSTLWGMVPQWDWGYSLESMTVLYSHIAKYDNFAPFTEFTQVLSLRVVLLNGIQLAMLVGRVIDWITNVIP
jgi:hypothetical protein